MTDSARAATRVCATCGRRFGWRRKWADCWDEVRYCGGVCRRARPGRLERELESAILGLAARRGRRSSICPSEAARSVAEARDLADWRPLMERSRQAVRRLAHRDLIEILQAGRRVDASDFRGPIRVRTTRRAQTLARRSG